MPSVKAAPQVLVASFYQFTRFDDCATIQQQLKVTCRGNEIRGTLIVATEGINGTIAGDDEALRDVIGQIRSLPGCSGMPAKYSRAAAMPFDRMKVKIKREIVTFGEPGLSPLDQVGEYVAPSEWNALISDPDTILIDARNSYEVAVGTFRDAIDPNTDNFREFPDWFRAHRASLSANKAQKIALFCTGGIRCEKATALLKSEGLENVYHLQGGILKYLEEVPVEDSLWEGQCFVFDQRESLAHGLEPGVPGTRAQSSGGLDRDQPDGAA